MPYKDKEQARAAGRRFANSPKGKAAAKRGQQKYAATEAGRKKRAEIQRNYIKSEKGRKAKNAWNKTPKGRHTQRNHQLKFLYGITIADKQAMYDIQQGLCKLCQKQLPEMMKSCVEHCHKTNLIRGLVHDHCNRLIGLIENHPEAYLNIPAYLGERSDISPNDCSMSQLKYKPNISLI